MSGRNFCGTETSVQSHNRNNIFKYAHLFATLTIFLNCTAAMAKKTHDIFHRTDGELLGGIETLQYGDEVHVEMVGKSDNPADYRVEFINYGSKPQYLSCAFTTAAPLSNLPFDKNILTGLEKKTFETLESLSNIQLSEDLRKIIRYDTAFKRLVFTGTMSENDKKALRALSSDNGYLGAIESLFKRSQRKIEIEYISEKKVLIFSGKMELDDLDNLLGLGKSNDSSKTSEYEKAIESLYKESQSLKLKCNCLPDDQTSIKSCVNYFKINHDAEGEDAGVVGYKIEKKVNKGNAINTILFMNAETARDNISTNCSDTVGSCVIKDIFANVYNSEDLKFAPKTAQSTRNNCSAASSSDDLSNCKEGYEGVKKRVETHIKHLKETLDAISNKAIVYSDFSKTLDKYSKALFILSDYKDKLDRASDNLAEVTAKEDYETLFDGELLVGSHRKVIVMNDDGTLLGGITSEQINISDNNNVYLYIQERKGEPTSYQVQKSSKAYPEDQLKIKTFLDANALSSLIPKSKDAAASDAFSIKTGGKNAAFKLRRVIDGEQYNMDEEITISLKKALGKDAEQYSRKSFKVSGGYNFVMQTGIARHTEKDVEYKKSFTQGRKEGIGSAGEVNSIFYGETKIEKTETESFSPVLGFTWFPGSINYSNVNNNLPNLGLMLGVNPQKPGDEQYIGLNIQWKGVSITLGRGYVKRTELGGGQIPGGVLAAAVQEVKEANGNITQYAVPAEDLILVNSTKQTDFVAITLDLNLFGGTLLTMAGF